MGIPSELRAHIQAAQQAIEEFQQTGQVIDLDRAVSAWEIILQSSAFQRAKLDFQLAAMGKAGGTLLRRYWAQGRLKDLEQALKWTQEAVDLTPQSSPIKASFLNNLGTMLAESYQRSGDLADLEEAIQASQQAVDLTPQGSPDKATHLNNLGNRLADSYQRSGDLAALEKAIEVTQQAIDLTSDEHPDKAAMLSNLGIRWFTRYNRSDNPAFLEYAIQSAQQAVNLTPQGSPDKAGRLNNLGTILSSRFRRSGNLADLERAIQATQQAVDLAPDRSPEKAQHLNNLGNRLADRFQHSGDLADLLKAIHAAQQAVDLTPKNSRNKAGHLSNLGSKLVAHYQRCGNLVDLKDGRSAYQKALELAENVDPETLVKTSRAWGNWALERCAWDEAADAFQPGLKSIETLVHQHALRISKEAWLRESQGIPARYAYALARSDKLAQALEIIEAGRARLLSEQLSLGDIDLHALKESEPELSSRYKDLTEQAARWRTVELRQTQDVERVRSELRQVNERLSQLAEQIRQVEGFAHFLAPVEVVDIYQAAQDHPLAYVAATPAGGMALLTMPDGAVEVLWFDELTENKLVKQLQGSQDDPRLRGYLGAYQDWKQSLPPNISKSVKKQAFDSWLGALDVTTGWLWDALMGKLVNWLSHKDQSQCALIPTGLLTLLPLHAAWTEDDTTPTGRRFALDEILFTYAPNAQALRRAQQNAQRPADRILAVDNPDRTLNFSEKEVQAVIEHFAEQAHLQHQEATFDAIAREMADAHVLHFATHGLAHFQQPLESLLVTADQPLKLRDILPLDLDQARLAVLSACETGLPGTRNIDEVIALPTGLLQAGVPGVASSMWLVADVSAMMLMERFYSLWREDRFSPAEALRKAQQWLRDTTNEKKQTHYEEWVRGVVASTRMPADSAQVVLNEILIKKPEERSFSHPFCWAAFAYYGI